MAIAAQQENDDQRQGQNDQQSAQHGSFATNSISRFTAYRPRLLKAAILPPTSPRLSPGSRRKTPAPPAHRKPWLQDCPGPGAERLNRRPNPPSATAAASATASRWPPRAAARVGSSATPPPPQPRVRASAAASTAGPRTGWAGRQPAWKFWVRRRPALPGGKSPGWS